jgi:CheY-like chemotaxis protein
VTDTGAGIPDDIRSHIFEPFFTTKGPGHGTGLGLATIYGIVKQHEGYIWVDSAPGRGTTFTVCLPASTSPAAWTAPVEDLDLQCRGSETVLLVEDYPAVRAMAREALERYGYRVIAAGNGYDALQAVQSAVDDISIVLTDVSMPVMGGHELAVRLRALRPDLKVVFTSGHASDPGATVGRSDPATAFLQKPFTPALLGRVMRGVLDANANFSLTGATSTQE